MVKKQTIIKHVNFIKRTTNNLDTIIFDDDFNEEINEKIFPVNLHAITFGQCYNQQIKKGI